MNDTIIVGLLSVIVVLLAAVYGTLMNHIRDCAIWRNKMEGEHGAVKARQEIVLAKLGLDGGKIE